uniref:Uncharacterized protein n=1 Tax=Rhizophora mucronata TaxID=61149 RepID=A0A2P2R0B2_RHIMU
MTPRFFNFDNVVTQFCNWSCSLFIVCSVSRPSAGSSTIHHTGGLGSGRTIEMESNYSCFSLQLKQWPFHRAEHKNPLSDKQRSSSRSLLSCKNLP